MYFWKLSLQVKLGYKKTEIFNDEHYKYYEIWQTWQDIILPSKKKKKKILLLNIKWTYRIGLKWSQILGQGL